MSSSIFSLSFVLQWDWTTFGRNSFGEVRRWKMVQTLLWLRGRKYLDADVHGSVFRIRERNIFLQVRNFIEAVMFAARLLFFCRREENCDEKKWWSLSMFGQPKVVVLLTWDFVQFSYIKYFFKFLYCYLPCLKFI